MLATLTFAAALLSGHDADGVGFVGFTPKEEAAWTYHTPYSTTKIYQLEPIDPGFVWNELIVSWNVEGGEGLSFEAKAKVLGDGTSSAMYSFGKWSLGKGGRRESIKDQKDDWGRVDTDTLILKKPARQVQLQLTLTGPQKDDSARVRFVGVSFRNSALASPPREPRKGAWGKVIEVPQRSQMSYPGGNVWCSPTCVSMLLWHWANETNQPELNQDVPAVAASVMDPNWPGTGNWSFNVAYAGSFPGIRAYVTRLASVSEIEEWIAAGIPVVTSVSSAMLKGKPAKEPNDGHLVVVVGFTSSGDPVFNDPGRSKEIRQTYKRGDFERAWKSSGNTVYLIYPDRMKTPPNKLAHWSD